MKYVNLIKLLSVLVCLLVVLAACNDKSAEDTTGAATSQQTENELTTTNEETTTEETEEETTTRGPVDPVLENYFVFPQFTPPTELKEAKEIEGELVASTVNNELIIIRQAKLGFDNTVTETFTVYNTMLGKTVLTVDNTYPYGEYDAFDWNNIYDVNGKSFPESDMDVSIGGEYDYMTGSYESVYIVVKKAEFKKIDEEVREENPYGADYEVTTSYVYYDAAGTEFARSKALTPERQMTYDSSYSYALSVGDTLAIFDSATYELISVTDSMKNKVVGGFDVEVGKSGYILDAEIDGALGRTESFLEIYDLESGECTLRYRYEHSSHSSFVLNNGNVLITYTDYIDEGDVKTQPDIIWMGVEMTVDNYLLDVKTGKVEPIDFNYMPVIVLNRQEYIALGNDIMQITENVDNVMIGIELDGVRTELSDMRIMALDNDLTVSFVMDPLVPEQNPAEMLNDGGIVTLENGDYLVTLDSAATSRAIVTKDGLVRSYLKADAEVVGDFVVTPNGVYDYDMKPLFAFETDGYSFVADVCGKIIVSKLTTKIDMLHNTTEDVLEYYSLDLTESGFSPSQIFEDQTVVPDKTEDDYIVTVHNETGKYTLYNINLEHILTTSSAMYICEIDGKYTVRTERSDGYNTVSVLYTLE